MIEITSFLQNIGSRSLEILWFPLTIWSAFSLLIYAGLNRMHAKHPLYHHRLRIALMTALPLGILFSGFTPLLNSLSLPPPADSQSFSFILIQNPFTVFSAANPQAVQSSAVDWGAPNLWIGLLTLIFLSVKIYKLLHLARDYFSISIYAGKLPQTRLGDFEEIRSASSVLSETPLNNIRIAFCTASEVPFTFGWLNPVIVVPSPLKKGSKKLQMIVRHELMHIKRGDFLLNVFVKMIKALFWWHPLVHLFDKDIEAYREMACDSEVLADPQIPRKQYARLLLELAPQKPTYAQGIISMAVNRSTLQKRIKTMKTLTRHHQPFKKSLLMSLILLAAGTALIACSHLQKSTVLATNVADRSLSATNNTDMHRSANLNEAPHHPGAATGKMNAQSRPVNQQLPKLKGRFLQSCLRYPDKARKAGIEGLAIVQFTVSTKGTVEDPEIARGVGGGIDEEALRCMKLATFEPAREGDTPVRMEVSQPFMYRLAVTNKFTGMPSDSIKTTTNAPRLLPAIVIVGYVPQHPVEIPNPTLSTENKPESLNRVQ